MSAKKALLKRLETLEGVLAGAQIGAKRRQVERLSDEELDALEAWYEAGQPGEWSAWVEERLAQPNPEAGSGGSPVASPDPEDPDPPEEPPPPAEVKEEPRVRLSTDLPEPHPRRGKAWEVTMVKAESGPRPRRFSLW
jgi:hypothetical protein